jgi:hypothetical protein
MKNYTATQEPLFFIVRDLTTKAVYIFRGQGISEKDITDTDCERVVKNMEKLTFSTTPFVKKLADSISNLEIKKPTSDTLALK